MKKTLIALFLLCAILLTACHKGDTSQVALEIGPSQFYTDGEIRAAMNLVLQKFKGFEGCTLLRLYYDEERSQKVSDQWAEQYNAEEAIVLYSTFDVDPSGINPSLNPGQTYENWSWVLTRNGGGWWTLQTWGY